MRNLSGLIALSLLATIAGCASSSDESTAGANVGAGNTFVPNLSADNPLASIEAGITALQGTCSIAAGVVTLNLVSTGEVVIVSKHPVSSKLVVNGADCDPANPVLATAVSRIDITGSDADDVVIIDYSNGTFALKTASAGGITVDLGADTADDTLALKGTAITDVVKYGATAISVVAAGLADITPTNVEIHLATLGAGNDTFEVDGTGFASTGVTVFGGAGNDTFNQGTVSSPNEIINGGEGSDTVSYALRAAATDSAIGIAFGSADSGEAPATLGVLDRTAATWAGTWTSTEADTINADVEIVVGGQGNDVMKAPSTAQTLIVHTLSGGTGDDILYAGKDVVSPEILNGDAGGDTLVDPSTATDGVDAYNGGAGTDSVSFASRTDALILNMGGTAVSGATGETDKIGVDIENIFGGTGADTITGNTLDNVIQGGAGADIIAGGTGIDTVSYADKSAAVTVDLTLRTATQGTATDTDTIAADIENVIGSPTAANTLTGSAGDNELVGGTAVDTIIGGDGNDIIDAGAGTSKADVITCGGDLDLVYNASLTSAYVDVCEIIRVAP